MGLGDCLEKIFNRVVEDRIDPPALRAAGEPWLTVSQLNDDYEQVLASTYSCDFSHLLLHFLEFLNANQSNAFLQGHLTEVLVRPPLTHVLVDEYQDTNPIQEEIYLRLCDSPPHNLTVVGDDDQALYRFRGGTVECMVGFTSACQQRWGVAPPIVYLTDNHRSDSDIVTWCNDYIGSFAQMGPPNVRIAGKPQLSPFLGRTGTGVHPAVALIRRPTIAACADDFATLVHDLVSNGIVQDYSQCALLLRSTRNTQLNAGPYQTALENRGIPVYNPRSKDFQEQPEIAQALGAFVRIVDPDLQNIGGLMSGRIRDLVGTWVTEFDTISQTHPVLEDYVVRGAAAIRNKLAGEMVTTDLPAILYRIYSHQPFVTYQQDPETDLRLSKLTRLFEAFCSQYGRPLQISTTQDGELHGAWYGNFYYGLCGYIVARGLDDDEEDEVVCPPDYLPIMTVHQAKGLEFDFVFAGTLGRQVRAGDAHYLEQDLRPFRRAQPIVVHQVADAIWHDDVRQHFVAYSKAKYGLILLATNSQVRSQAGSTASFGGPGGGWMQQRVPML